jgi:UDP-N-acetylmuramoyl-tripeptide--D-alanyl-D-alanine ligase
MQLTLAEIAAILETAPPAAGQLQVSAYSIDSRTIQPGELFFAVKGQKLDGHDYVQAALEKGAAAAVVATSRRAAFPAALQSKLLGVRDPLAALQSLAAYVRQYWGGPVVAVTGSAGKTTTKQMIAALLGTRLRVLENQGNLNNQFGLPLSLLRLETEHEIGVFELGMSAPGEIRLLAQLARPDVGVVTNVSAAHLEFFPDVDAIALAKRELVETLGMDSWAVLNADDPRVAAFGASSAASVVEFGIARPAHFRAEELRPDENGGTSFRLPAYPYWNVPAGAAWKGKREVKLPREGSGETAFYLPLLGRHNVLNVLPALAICYLFGIRPSSLATAVASLRPGSMRGELVRLSNGVLVVNDCYNSNPEALETMLGAVATFPARRRLAVLGGMMELGPQSDALHFRCGRRLAELRFAGLITVGEQARSLGTGASAAGMPKTALAHFATPEEAGDRLRDVLREGDVVLLKASRAVHLEKVWDRLGPLAPRSNDAVAAGARSPGATKR